MCEPKASPPDVAITREDCLLPPSAREDFEIARAPLWLELRMPIAALEAAQAEQLFVFPSGVQTSYELLLLSP